jgi:high-affinity iron transporter
MRDSTRPSGRWSPSVRRALPILTAVCAALALPASASGAEEQFSDALADLERARELTDRSVEVAESGDRERAYEIARTAYLDHFEFVEIPLRLRDPNLVLDLEFEFAELRDSIQAGAPMGEIQDTAQEIQAGLDDVERELSDPGVAAPAVAFAFSFSILFREGLEAVLLLAVLLGSLEAARAANYRRPLAWGAGAAIGATALTFVLATTVIEVAPVDRELLEAGAALLAVAVLFAVTFWLVSRLEQRRWMEFMRTRVSAAIAAGGALAFAGLGFTAVYREGFETVLFYQALTLFAEGLILWVVLGAAAAALALGGLGYAIFGLGRRLPIRPMLIAGASILLLLSVAFVGNAVRSLQSADVIGATPIEDGWARQPIFLAELTGIHPTVEGVAVQAALLGIYALGALWVFVARPLRARRAGRLPETASP